MTLYKAHLYPGWALGDIFVLGSFAHTILTRVKAEPQHFPQMNVIGYTKTPVTRHFFVDLPANGIRLRFDGPEQRLRLIEISDFTKNHISYKPSKNDKEMDLVRPASTGAGASTNTSDATSGPTIPGLDNNNQQFRHIYSRFLGPTYDGEFIPEGGNKDGGTYVLSYPGVAFNFNMRKSEYSPEKDVVTLLDSSSKPRVATQMAIFSGEGSWTQAQVNIDTALLPSMTLAPPYAKSKETFPDEVSLIKVHGGGKLQLFRKWTSNSTWLTLGEATEQDLIHWLGPPDAKFWKSENNMAVHQQRAEKRPGEDDLRRQDDLTDTDQSSGQNSSDGADSSDEDDEDDLAANVSDECFYNYFYHGFDILVTRPKKPSQTPPSRQNNPLPAESESFIKPYLGDQMVATKVIIHGNVPFSFPFNRYRRCRWEIAYLAGEDGTVINSETSWTEIEKRMRKEWETAYASEEAAKHAQRGMVINRGWGESPSSSTELLGGWEEDERQAPAGTKKIDEDPKWKSTFYSFPGLVFEVLKNGFVSSLNVA